MYKYESAGDWLAQKIQGFEAGTEFAKLREFAVEMAGALDNDTIQDLFQSDMEDDGFFDPDVEGVEPIRLSYRCRDIGYGVEEGTIDGYFTGEIDTWGKRTFQLLDRSAPLYLFEDEILEQESLAEAAQ